jgi:hypothetical protein
MAKKQMIIILEAKFVENLCFERLVQDLSITKPQIN